MACLHCSEVGRSEDDHMVESKWFEGIVKSKQCDMKVTLAVGVN